MKNNISQRKKHIASITLFFGYTCLYPIGLIINNYLTGSDTSRIGMFHIAYSSIVAQLGIGLIYLSVELYKKPKIKNIYRALTPLISRYKYRFVP